MRITVLGSGTSHGVPMIGCNCSVCTSDDPLNKRNRPSLYVETATASLVIDTGPEFRLQALANRISRVDAALYTHSHADHIFGLDDLRRFNDLGGSEIPIYGSEATLLDICRAFDYIFKATQAGGGKPRIAPTIVQPSMTIFGTQVNCFNVMHGTLPVLAYRIGGMAYVTDVSEIPEQAWPYLADLDLLILDAVRYEPHPTHFGLYQALEVVEKVRPRRTLLTHLSHLFDHRTLSGELPKGVEPAFDGQTIELVERLFSTATDGTHRPGR